MFSAVALLAAITSAAPATLVIYRDGAEPLLFRPQITVDGIELGRLPDRRFHAVALPPGNHRIEARWPALAGHRPAAIKVTAKPGTAIYLELVGTAAFWRTRASTAIVERNEGDARARLAECCAQLHGP